MKKKTPASFGVKMMFYLRTVLRCSVSFFGRCFTANGLLMRSISPRKFPPQVWEVKEFVWIGHASVTAKNKCTAYDEVWNLILDTHYNVIFKSNLIRWLWCIRMIKKNPF